MVNELTLCRGHHQHQSKAMLRIIISFSISALIFSAPAIGINKSGRAYG
jgi:hypothetical protein